MYNPIQLTIKPITEKLDIEHFSLNPLKENVSEDIVSNHDNALYTEAVFTGGKQSVSKITEKVQKVKDLLDAQIKEQDDSIKAHNDAKKDKSKKEVPKINNFDPKAFWRDQVFKDLEDEIAKIFGFRHVSIQPFIEKYNSTTKDFQSKQLNCMVYHSDRYPIDGLVTDKGFYDKTHSLIMDIRISLGLIKLLTAEEIVAVLLHEFGHNIDPAIVDIKYTEVNILSKYLTDRKQALNNNEKKVMKSHKFTEIAIIGGIYLLFILITLGSSIIDWIKEKILGKEKYEQQKLEKVKKMIADDKERFNRQNYSEAFADNFARMYGFGSQLASSLKKMSKDNDKYLNSRIKKEKARQDAIINITEMMIKDVHKTDIHRIRSLIKEYKDDINDPNIPDKVKKDLKEDLAELEKVLDEYLNNFSEFQNRVNKIINEELEKIEIEDGKKSDNKKDSAIKEGFIFFDKDSELITESKKAYEKLLKAEESITSKERAEIKEKFGTSNACSFGKDDKGYYCFTHRCRSKSYPTISDIPQKDVDFVRSTS